jgi:hypothetical protein
VFLANRTDADFQEWRDQRGFYGRETSALRSRRADAAGLAPRCLSAAGNGYSTNQFRCVQRVLDRATFEIERAEEEPAFTKLVYLEGSL